MTSLLTSFRLAETLTDAVIVAEGVEFPVHKVILCNCSPYFRALFSRWSGSNQKVFHIPGVSSAMMQLIINYAYKENVTATKDNVLELLEAADQMNVLEVVYACKGFLVHLMCPENCIGMWRYAILRVLPNLQCKAYSFILEHFEKVALCEEFLELSADELSDIIEKDNLNIRNESKVFEAILRWTSHALPEREQHFSVLLSKVRLPVMNAEYFRENVLPNPLVKNSSLALLCENMISHDNASLSTPHWPPAFSLPRLPNAILMAIGGWNAGHPTDAIELYDVHLDRWSSLTPSLEYPCAYHGTVILNGYIYCLGGFNTFQHFSRVHKFDLVNGTWHEAAPMYHRRCYISVTVLNGRIYAMGGFNGHRRLKEAESYEPMTNQWNMIAPMHVERSDTSCTTFNNKIYICGGFNGIECLQTAEYYTPETNQWTMIAPMIRRRSGIRVIAYASHIYAVGGFDGERRLRSAEAYDPENNSWRNIASMKTKRSNFGIEVIEDRIFVVGGFNGHTTCSNVECYDATSNEWSEVCNMEVHRSALSCCVISGLPNMTDYIVPRVAHPLMPVMEGEQMES
ncbi:kelch-like protein 10 [Cyprinodon tularosa]|uniref:kelch-like protein 10 n=1 Tax=Cyprinodon tularosa TaxID=77115 RepID=UPI0018E20594|nr:kelch-like protein 10 [Cyprinodon tularosa]